MDAQTAAMWDEFAKLGDVNRDGYINQKDVAIMQKSWGCTVGQACYNPAADLNGDGIVNTLDLAILASHYGENIWTYFDIPKPKPILLYAILGGVGIAAAVGIGVYALKRRG